MKIWTKCTKKKVLGNGVILTGSSQSPALFGGGGATVNTVSTVTVMFHVVDSANFTINHF